MVYLQKLMRDARRLMTNELRRLKEFGTELTQEGLAIIGGILCSAHYLETSIQDPDSKLIAFDGGKISLSFFSHSALYRSMGHKDHISTRLSLTDINDQAYTHLELLCFDTKW